MTRSVLLSLQLYVTAAFPWQTDPADAKPADVFSATLLRGSQAAQAARSQKVDTKSELPSGHLFHAKECRDCYYKGMQCGCEPAMEYLACLTEHCYTSDQPKFTEMCSVVQEHCDAELE